MKKYWTLGLLAGLMLVQVALPVSMIAKRETTLKYGTAFRFKTAPVDPYDAFRGRYVALRVEVNKVNKPGGMELKYGQKVYAQLSVDENGFATIAQVAVQKPGRGAYLEARAGYSQRDEVQLDLPIDRYYMEEKSAPRAERVYREHSVRGKQDAYVVVRVMDGFAVIEGLYIDGRKIEDLLRAKS